MTIEVRQVGIEFASRYGEVPIAFCVESILEPESLDAPGIVLREVRGDEPYEKDYDTDTDDSDHPQHWAERWDTSHWGFFAAFDGDAPVGWAVVATRTPNMNVLEGRADLAVLWDIRIHQEWRRRGIGTRLFNRAADSARRQDCRQLKIETQNVNVPACRFYAARGCRLGGIVPGCHAYPPSFHHEYTLLWYLELSQQLECGTRDSGIGPDGS